MWVLVLLAAVSVAVTLAARRRASDARDSVTIQQQRLDALRTAVSAADLPSAPTGTAVARPLPQRRTRGRSSPIRLRTAVLVVMTLVALGAGAMVVADLVSSTDSTDGAKARQAAAERRSRAASDASTTSTTTTTKPAGAAIVGTQAGVITISVPAVAYGVTLTARGSCWLRAQRADNTVLETTTLHAGDSKDLAGNGPLTVRLGNPGVIDVAVNGETLTLPLQNGGAVDLHLVPPGSST